jgi:alpha-galactosidase
VRRDYAAAVSTAGLVHLRGGGASLVIDARGPGVPGIAHWGADLGSSADLESVALALQPPLQLAGLDVPVPPSLVPELAAGYRGRPGLSGARADGSGRSPLFLLQTAASGEHEARFEAADRQAGLALRSEIELGPTGVVRLRNGVRNTGTSPYRVDELCAVLPLPPPALEVLDMTGRWCRERAPQRRLLGQGTWLRETRHGRTGHDAPFLLVAGTPGWRFRSGEVWGVHLAWSGDAAHWAQRLPDGTAALGAAELLGPGEVVLDPGEWLTTPWLYGVWSDRGLDGLSAALHAWVRARPSHPRSPRPVVLNTWEAVYFDHRHERLSQLADTAAALGVERFVLDDGWFRHRRDDSAGLGDWLVDEEVWPQGLGPLIDHVRELGMEFGLWVEPEMVSPDSDLCRAHPEWVLGPPGRMPPSARRQQVLDLANPDAYAHVAGRLHALLDEHEIAFLKWDHNRDLVDAEHGGRPAVRGQTLAAYRLLDELRARHPGLEIESCSSGGARVDLGVLERTDRVWASDTNDALERQAIQRWTALLLPPELIGAHVGPPRAHTTGRTHDLSFRVATALFGHFGLEWDVGAASAEERAGVAKAIALYKRHRALLHSGEVVRVDHPDTAAFVHGVVAADGDEALFAYVQLTTSALERPGRARLEGLRPGRTYRVTPRAVAGAPRLIEAATPLWYGAGWIVLDGRTLGRAGLEMPILAPEQALLLHLIATS